MGAGFEVQGSIYSVDFQQEQNKSQTCHLDDKSHDQDMMDT